MVAAVAAIAPSTVPAAAISGPALAIDATATGPTGRHAISDDIYGLNFAYEKRAFEDSDTQLAADQAFAAEIRVPFDRWGGNATTRYNWVTGVSNHAADFFFENIPQSPDHNGFIAFDRAHGARTMLTVNTLGYVARADSPVDHPYFCGFRVSKYFAQRSRDVFDPDCGDGVKPGGDTFNGPFVVGNDPADTSTAVPPSFIGSWVADQVTRYGQAASGGVRDYALDNEPELWFTSHRDVHPTHLTYDELVSKDSAVAAAIKTADPTARVVGPNGWGYSALFDLQFDTTSPSADKTAHRGADVAAWFLSQMAAYGQSQGGRVLDTFDEHFYPAQTGVALAPAGDAATQALRLRSVRSLWDPTYLDESWIADAYQDTDKVYVRFIPRLHEFVDQNYPGTKIGIGEYNFGGLDSINGALAQADVLGVFARERLDQATMWSPPHAFQPGAFAFRMFRNLDGAGGSFGDTYVKSTSTDQGKVAVYGAQRGANGALTVAVINKTAGDLTSPLSLANFNAGTSAQVFRYSAADLTRIVRQADAAVANRALTTTFPANSITMLVVPPGGAAAALAATPSTVAAGKPLTVSWSGIASPTNADLVALYPSSNTGDTAHIAYRYTGGGASGSLMLTVPANAAPGTAYELRLWSNNGAQRLATSTPFNITAAPAPTVSATPTPVKAGSALTVSWSGIAAPTNADLVALYPRSDTGDTAHIAYRYTGGAASGSLSLTVPANAVPGTTYELRLWSNNGAKRLATFSPFTVTR